MIALPPPPPVIDLPLGTGRDRVRRHRGAYRRAAVAGFFVWLAQGVLAGIGLTAALLVSLLLGALLFLAGLALFLWYISPHH